VALTFAHRWHVELDLRKLKTTCGMHVLRCQTPQMNDKQLWTQWTAHTMFGKANWLTGKLANAAGANRPMQGRSSIRPHRATHAQTTTQTDAQLLVQRHGHARKAK
jgi:hypothetical protein